MKKEKISILIVSRVFYLFPVENKQKKSPNEKLILFYLFATSEKMGFFSYNCIT